MPFAIVASASLVAAIALSGTSADAPAPANEVTFPMTVVDWDAATATENGYQIQLDEDGRLESIYVGELADEAASVTAIADADKAAEARRDGPSYIVGDCGESYLFIESTGLGLQFVTGYLLYGKTASSHIWEVVTSTFWTSDYWDLSGSPLGAAPFAWQDAREFSSTTVGSYDAEVLYGFTANTDGSICFSGGPGDSWGR